MSYKIYTPLLVLLFIQPISPMSLNNSSQDTSSYRYDGETDNSLPPLIAATLHTDSYKNVESLIKSGADVNQQNVSGYTPLIIAVANNNTEVINLLLDSGADINLQDKNGYTALMIAAICDYTEIIDLLISRSADLNLLNKNGETAFDFFRMWH